MILFVSVKISSSVEQLMENDIIYGIRKKTKQNKTKTKQKQKTEKKRKQNKTKQNTPPHPHVFMASIGDTIILHMFTHHSSILLTQILQLSRNASTTNLMHVTAI